MTTPTNRTALITGGGRGIGLGISICLAKEGYDLAICGIKEEQQVKETLEGLQKLGVKVCYCQADISKTEDRKRLMDRVRKTYGKLNVLVNNAGVAPKVRADILEADEASFERLIKINLQGPYFLTQAAANWMIKQKNADQLFHACIITISSISATVASPSRGDYCLSKAGLSMSTQLWATRLGEYNIPVYELRPGVIKTDMTAAVEDKYTKLIAEGLCLQARWGLPEDTGKAVAMLARGDLPYSTGQAIYIDGGLTIQRL